MLLMLAPQTQNPLQSNFQDHPQANVYIKDS